MGDRREGGIPRASSSSAIGAENGEANATPPPSAEAGEAMGKIEAEAEGWETSNTREVLRMISLSLPSGESRLRSNATRLCPLPLF